MTFVTADALLAERRRTKRSRVKAARAALIAAFPRIKVRCHGGSRSPWEDNSHILYVDLTLPATDRRQPKRLRRDVIRALRAASVHLYTTGWDFSSGCDHWALVVSSNHG